MFRNGHHVHFFYKKKLQEKKNHCIQLIPVQEVTHMSAEFSGVSEKIHGVKAPHSLCYQGL